LQGGDDVAGDELRPHAQTPITVREASELRILTIIADTDAPVGSRVLRQRLLQEGVDLSEATAGRWLSELTEQNLLAKRGRRGRVLTEAGSARLTSLQSRHDSLAGVSDLFQIYKALDPAHLLDLLHARRLVEPEIARLAALRSTDRELERMAEAADPNLSRQVPDGASVQDVQRREATMIAWQDSHFHSAVAQGAHSPALAVTVRLLRSAEPHFPIFVRVREYMGHRVLIEHQEIADAILRRDADLAQDLMHRHIDGVLSDVERYARNETGQELYGWGQGKEQQPLIPEKRPIEYPSAQRFSVRFPVKATVFATVEVRSIREVMLAPSTAHVVQRGDVVQISIRVREDRRPYVPVRDIALVEVREAGILAVGD
jgi:GntR family L-lactate dehydrogenase operon transcriptional regulator